MGHLFHFWHFLGFLWRFGGLYFGYLIFIFCIFDIHILQILKGGKLVAHHGYKKEEEWIGQLHLENWCLESVC